MILPGVVRSPAATQRPIEWPVVRCWWRSRTAPWLGSGTWTRSWKGPRRPGIAPGAWPAPASPPWSALSLIQARAFITRNTRNPSTEMMDSHKHDSIANHTEIIFGGTFNFAPSTLRSWSSSYFSSVQMYHHRPWLWHCATYWDITWK